jgi:predicted CXXCH cytochrome family protein
MKQSLSYRYHDVLTLQEYLPTLLFLLNTIVFNLIPQTALAEQPSAGTRCCRCHNDICEVNLKKMYVHLPFLQNRCSVCHVDDGAAAGEETKTSSKEIAWLGEHFSPAVNHWFIIPADLIGSDKLIVVARDVMGQSHEERIPLPAIETMQLKVNDGKPPGISSAVGVGVYRGIMISARIDWLTDEESDSEIQYGIDTLKYSVKADQLTTDHEIVLQNLKAGQKYQYIIICRDIFGNRAESDGMFFSTDNLSPYPPLEYGQQKTDIVLDARFLRNGDSYLVKFTANQPVILSVGSERVTDDEEIIPAAVIADNPDHLPMRSREELSISVCNRCHAGIKDTGSHPVNVGAGLEVTIPADYSTGPDGRITCMTCHTSHASRFQFRTIKSASQELCVGCHEGYAPPF